MTMPTRNDVLDVLREIPDPEMPISIVDLGIVDWVDVRAGAEEAGSDDSSVVVDILPTFVGCPALDMIRDQVCEKVGKIPGVGGVTVNFIHDPPWTVDRITDAGRASLKEHGVTVPESGSKLPVHDSPRRIMTQVRTSAVPCPFCGSSSTYLDSPFGPTRCRMIFYCESCRNSFEHMKRV